MQILRDLYYTAGFKYRLEKNIVINIGSLIKPADRITSRFVDLSKRGLLTIKVNFCWDGPSGPTIDTRNSMIGALAHDALYYLMRKKLLDRKYRKQADIILRDICISQGMLKCRAGLWYGAVRKLASGAANPKNVKKVKKIKNRKRRT